MAEIDIQVIDPAEVTLPVHLRNISFLNRSIYPEVLYGDSSKWSDDELYVLDTLVNRWIFKGIRDKMNESPLFFLDSLRIVQARRKDTLDALKPLTDFQLQQLKNVQPADALLSLEYYFVLDTSGVGLGLEEAFRYYAYMGFYITTVWRIYDLVEDSLIDTHTSKAYLDWEAPGETVEDAYRGLPNATDAIRETVFLSGANYAQRISPVWQDAYRFYYKEGGKEIRRASGLVASADWEAAAEAWMKLADEPNPKVSSRACFNLALYFEMEDNIVTALNWAVRSYEINQHKLTRQYIDLLRKRYSDRRKLKEQLPG